MTDPVVEAALSGLGYAILTEGDEHRMRRSLAAAYRAEAERLTIRNWSRLIANWLHKRAAELDGQSDGGRG